MPKTNLLMGFKGDPLPDIVKQHADQDHMTPLAWQIHPDKVVIVYCEGPKMVYKLQSPLSNHPTPVVDNLSTENTPVIHSPSQSIAPAVQKLPVKVRKH